MSGRTESEWNNNPFQIGVKYKVTGVTNRVNMLDWFTQDDEIEFLGLSTAVTGLKNHSKNDYQITLTAESAFRSVGTTIQKERIDGFTMMVTTQWTVKSNFTSEAGESVSIGAEIIGTSSESPDGDVITIPPPQ